MITFTSKELEKIAATYAAGAARRRAEADELDTKAAEARRQVKAAKRREADTPRRPRVTRMSKTEAAETVARRAMVFARRTGQLVTKLAIEEAATAMLHCEPGTDAHTAAQIFNYKTAYRIACARLRDNGEAHLIGR